MRGRRLHGAVHGVFGVSPHALHRMDSDDAAGMRSIIDGTNALVTART